MAPVKSPDAIRDLLENRVAGRTVRDLTVHGINTLKTLEPSVGVLVGQQILRIEAEHCQRIVLHLQSAEVIINLERTGGLEWRQAVGPWSPTREQVQPPTARLLLDTGSGVDFKEPGRTKRITFALTRTTPAA